uniref:Transmembrane protein n=1 Tax=Panagrellus redivivus TaxID=6233 RepID=A0A7E4VIF3_PANRE
MACHTGRAAAPLLILLLLNTCWLFVLGHDHDHTTTLSPEESKYARTVAAVVFVVLILCCTAVAVTGCVIGYLLLHKKKGPTASATPTGSGQSAANPAYDV